MKKCLLLGLVLAGAMNTCQAAFLVNTVINDGRVGSLQWAIDQAEADPSETVEIIIDPSDGSTILHNSGTFLTKNNYTIRGASDRRDITLDGDGNGQVLRALATLSATTSFTIENLTLSNGVGDQSGACLQVLDYDQVLIENVTIESCEGRVDPAVDIRAPGDVTIRNSRFRNNTVLQEDGFFHLGSALLVSARTLGSGSLTISDSEFANNAVSDEAIERGVGGPIFVNVADVQIDRTLFLNNYGGTADANRSMLGGAIYMRLTNNSGPDPAASLTITRSVFRNYDSNRTEGGVVYAWGENMEVALRNNAFVGNAGYSSGLVQTRVKSLEASGNLIASNESSAGTAGIYFRDIAATQTLQLSYNTFTQNNAPGAEFLQVNSDDYSWNDASANLILATGSNLCSIANPANGVLGAHDNHVSDSCGLPQETMGLSLADFQISDPDAINTPLVRLQADSALIDSVAAPDSGTCPMRDIINGQRPLDGDGDTFALCDPGAYERGSTRLFADSFGS